MSRAACIISSPFNLVSAYELSQRLSIPTDFYYITLSQNKNNKAQLQRTADLLQLDIKYPFSSFNPGFQKNLYLLLIIYVIANPFYTHVIAGHWNGIYHRLALCLSPFKSKWLVDDGLANLNYPKRLPRRVYERPNHFRLVDLIYPLLKLPLNQITSFSIFSHHISASYPSLNNNFSSLRTAAQNGLYPNLYCKLPEKYILFVGSPIVTGLNFSEKDFQALLQIALSQVVTELPIIYYPHRRETIYPWLYELFSDVIHPNFPIELSSLGFSSPPTKLLGFNSSACFTLLSLYSSPLTVFIPDSIANFSRSAQGSYGDLSHETNGFQLVIDLCKRFSSADVRFISPG